MIFAGRKVSQEDSRFGDKLQNMNLLAYFLISFKSCRSAQSRQNIHTKTKQNKTKRQNIDKAIQCISKWLSRRESISGGSTLARTDENTTGRKGLEVNGKADSIEKH